MKSCFITIAFCLLSGCGGGDPHTDQDTKAIPIPPSASSRI